MAVKSSKTNENEKKEEKEISEKNEEQKEKEFFAPDGGWGWMIVIGYGISNIVVIPLIQSFGLIFIDRFHELNFNSTDITTLISLNSWFGMILGIFNGHLLKTFGYRTMAFAGISLFSTGFFLTGFATKYFHFVIAWGMIASLGFIWLMASFSFAINSYFKVRRSHASGRASFLTGLGPIFMPLVISFLLKTYGLKWSIFILAAINLHSFVGACLLQPVARHERSKPLVLEKETSFFKKLFPRCFKKEESTIIEVYEDVQGKGEEKEEKPIEFIDTVSLFGGGSSISGSRRSLYRRPSATPSGKFWNSQDCLQRPAGGIRPYELIRSVSESHAKRREKSITRLDNDDHDDMLRSMIHLLERPSEKEKVALASMESLTIEKDKVDCNEPLKRSYKRLIRPSISSIVEYDAEEIEALKAEIVISEDEKNKTGCWQKIWAWIKENYDLDLLADPIYINITIGMSIAIIGELMFSLLTPFILDDLGLDLDQKAVFMSIVAISDIISRYIAPYAGDLLKFHSRAMYVTALFLLFMTRGLMFLPTSYEGFLAVAVALGLAKGVRTVYWALVIPDYVPLKKYPSAAAIQSLANGILLALSGPIIGAIISISGSYSNAIIACNVLTLVTVAMWYIEFGIVWFADRRKHKNDNQVDGGA